MKAVPLAFRGAYLLEGASHWDDRGSFERIVDFEALDSLGIDREVTQVSTAYNRRRGTVRGLHYQVPPHEEAKTLWCAAGSIFDVLVDLRADEDTFGQWISVELSSGTPGALHVPRGVAHGYQTTTDDTTLTYLISGAHAPESSRAINWRDSTLAIPWPMEASAISARDAAAPSWNARAQP